MSGWEDDFVARILKLRNIEVSKVQHSAALKAWNEVVFFVCNSLTSLIIFCIHVGTGGVLTPFNVFTTISLVNVVQLTLTKYTAQAVMFLSEVHVSITRIQLFLEAPEHQKQSTHQSTSESVENSGRTVISLNNLTCYWDLSSTGKNISLNHGQSISASIDCEDTCNASAPKALDDVNLELHAGELCCIIGPVGSGKSSLLLAITGELPIAQGSIERNYKSLAYSPQEAWIMNGSVRDNIILDRRYDEPWYETVIASCGLKDDFLQLSSGDQTLVGDRGTLLSGGQRARINLARALYRDAEVLVLDDPLSAVDSGVSSLLFHSAIHDLGVKRGKCVVLATHQHQYIGNSRCVLMIGGGKVLCDGSYNDCISSSGGLLSRAVQNNKVTKESSSIHCHTKHSNGKAEDKSSYGQVNTCSSLSLAAPNLDNEVSESGIMQFGTYRDYVNAMGGIFVAMILLILFAAAQVSVLLLMVYFGRWAAMPSYVQPAGYIFAVIIGGVICILTAVRSLTSFYFCIKASKNLHNKMTQSVLRAKIEFFDMNPLGRILNRFSADVGISDDLLPNALHDFLSCAFSVLGGISTTFSVLPITLVAFPPLICYFIHIRNSFVKSSRELKRFEGLARSPIFDMLSESLNGITTIRSNNVVDYFCRKFPLRHDAHSRAFFQFIAISRWLAFRLDAMMFVLLALCSFSAVIVKETGLIKIDQTVLGLALSLLLQLGGLFQWMVRQNAEVVNDMVSVERINGFCNLSSEANQNQDEDNELSGWPKEGKINIANLTVRYRENLPPSLAGVSCEIPGGARVGIVGRTGCGKSTFVQALFRILEPEGGSILIDGKDITRLGLQKLRRGMSVIPQTPSLFSGCSVRENLDPLMNHNDEEILGSLSDVQMLTAIDMLPGGLNYVVAENGSNFSVGQRQLLCLARAILRKNKILVIDEPTANVDNRTDKLLQQALRQSFPQSTILAVTHRLDTIIDYDLILVIGNGKELEYGSPARLLANPEGHFTSMVHDCGEKMERELHHRVLCN